ncbi:HlyD family secretion protein [Pseudomonas sp. R5(2019)]|uniref:HlyD family secretion protein n=1 Tax=Pseudomonas sp. R5(2019) TaxID=2697566 RepID=UPI001412F96B|nr:HlyD family secretion protein [Pseudomonas sp. R5(2019)]NBA97821.1 HlyD family efflux transporter periplasmic adaptor subunit [Pseudomonas sp. R5(2019)]
MKPSRTLTLTAVAAFSIALLASVMGAKLVGGTRQSTDDAYVAADFTLVAPKVAGFISQVLIEDNQRVKAGQLLAVIDDRDLRAAASAAHANALVAKARLQDAQNTLEQQSTIIAQHQAGLAEAQAALDFAKRELTRYDHLAGNGAGTVQNAQQARTRVEQTTARQARASATLAAARKQVDIFTAQRDAAAGSLEQAEANQTLADYQLSYTRIVAPFDGMVGERAVRVGAYVTPGSKLLAVVPLDKAYVIANFQETQLTDVRVGQSVSLSVDTFPDAALLGHVESIAPATGVTFAAVRPDNATGNFTKVVQRIPVKISLDANQPLLGHLRVGMSVQADIDTTSAAPEDFRKEVSQR